MKTSSNYLFNGLVIATAVLGSALLLFTAAYILWDSSLPGLQHLIPAGVGMLLAVAFSWTGGDWVRTLGAAFLLVVAAMHGLDAYSDLWPDLLLVVVLFANSYASRLLMSALRRRTGEIPENG
jgi:hypothetical protein